MRDSKQTGLKLLTEALFFLLPLAFILLTWLKSYSGETKEIKQGILDQQIESTHSIIKAKEAELQKRKEKNIEPNKELLEKAIERKAENLFTVGDNYYRAKKYEESIAIFKEALAIYPQHRKAKIYLKKSQLVLEKRKRKLSLEQKKELKVEATLKLLEEAKTKQINYHYLKGLELLRNGQYAEAIEQLNKVLFLDPSHKQAKIYLERAMSKAGKRVDIEIKLKDNFDLVKKYIENNEYGKAKEELLSIQKKIEDWEQAYKQEATTLALTKATERKSNKVINYLNEKDYALAKEEIGELLKRVSSLADEKTEEERKRFNSEKIADHFNSALDLIDKGDYRQAKFELKKILEIDPENEEAASLLKRVEEVLIISGSD